MVNGINEEAKRKGLFLSMLGSKGYKLVRSLAQNKPADKSYDELKDLLEGHLNPKPNKIAQRFKFFKRDRRHGESVVQYMAELRKLSEHCEFGGNLDESMRDRLVCGLNNERMQQKLLTMRDLTLKTAIETAVGIELAVAAAKELQGAGSTDSPGEIHKVEWRSGEDTGKVDCYRCGSYKHMADICPFKSATCFKCQKVGHTREKMSWGKETRYKSIGLIC